MGHTFQVTVDSTSPHTLADWWAETLGWQVEESDEDFIRSMVAQGHARAEDTTTHRGRLVWVEGAAIVDADGPAGTPRVLFQLVPEAKTSKNRVHLDVRVDDDVEAVRARLEERGATWLHDGAQGPHTWVTMADPEGNEFCVTA
ncbi:VOC family protein [Sanguibacter suaedae]|uniref:VOC family protein n=1 Tax=Sanguibacter suaedae TaxID=2795737 RepID=A0A934IB04_9MICO|nr:VOC family protein [Sanguibacter suaedae]MBI9115132.1 VOC family protein [Sanguibacter suaedae]